MRRRNQPEVSHLPTLVRFLNHAAAQRGLTQAGVAERLGNCSTSTLSRWFRGEVAIPDRDLESFGRVLDVPTPTLIALRVLETLRGGPMIATVAAWRYMAEGAGNRLLLSGATMHAGMVHILDARPAGKTILVSVHDPCADPLPLAAVDPARGIPGPGQGQAYWLTSLTTLRAIVRASPTTRVRLWVRPKDELVIASRSTGFVGQLAANDWIALEMASVVGRPTAFVAHFFRDEGWNRLVAPVFAMLEGDADAPPNELIWDSRWPVGDPRMERLRARLRVAVGGLSVDQLLG